MTHLLFSSSLFSTPDKASDTTDGTVYVSIGNQSTLHTNYLMPRQSNNCSRENANVNGDAVLQTNHGTFSITCVIAFPFPPHSPSIDFGQVNCRAARNLWVKLCPRLWVGNINIFRFIREF